MTTPTKKLHFAAKLGNASGCEHALANGADLLEADKDGLNALHLAAMNGHAQTCKVLLEHGADPQTLTSGY